MGIIKATYEHFEIVQKIVNETIGTVYPNYYPQGAVVFFLRHHSREAIQKAIAGNEVFLLEAEGEFVGTGSIKENEINRLFVLPAYQGKGFGTFMMDELEAIVFAAYPEAVLDASLPAYEMYSHRGYVPVEYHRIKTDNGHYLCYHVMKKGCCGKFDSPSD
ncbi:GNAT family N-acetyltransferase [Desulfitobacterium hafniense]|uniref:N-acetyltransferase domain-containing protein n=3 Tax=root TaxID=1 RepID=Q24YN3_DESHY|nr:GNAT family N-acetyltransferase [Desulfitobacterium hafniense]MEA5021796.1 GNAT family N-acetyltransferase [Desulfitobacterium hafniense]BAE82859.1 hypothetical protein DSY1070 [Desulfitobacterium hafniense Y51]CDX00995.1 GCN5-related N-acetyltransferase [Desulfitobacterium hafniense]